MTDNYFPKRKYLFIPNSHYDLKFKCVSGNEDEYITDYTLQTSTDDATYRIWNIRNSKTSEALGFTYPDDYMTGNFIAISLFEHLPQIQTRGIGSALDYNDMTSYEVAMAYSTPFNGDLTVDVYNADATGIEVLPIFEYGIDQSATGGYCDGIVAEFDVPMVISKVTAAAPGISYFLECGLVDASNVCQDRTKIELTDKLADETVITEIATGKQFFLLSANTDHTDTTVFSLEDNFYANAAINQGSVIRFTDRTDLAQYYSPFEWDQTVTYSLVKDFTDESFFADVTDSGGQIFTFSMTTQEPPIYRRKQLIFSNTSQTAIDTTFVVTDSTDGVIFSSNDATFSAEVQIDAMTTFALYSGSFAFGNTYDLAFDVRLTPCLSTDIVETNWHDNLNPPI